MNGIECNQKKIRGLFLQMEIVYVSRIIETK